MSSPARTLVDNLELSRSRGGRPSRTLTMNELEDWVARKHIAWGPRTHRSPTRRGTRPGGHNRTRSPPRHHQRPIRPTRRRRTGSARGRPAVRGQSRPVKHGTSGASLLFAQAADALSRLSPPAVPDWLPECDPPGDLPFYESYFSNYIEGTTFTVDQARHIVETDTPTRGAPSRRPRHPRYVPLRRRPRRTSRHVDRPRRTHRPPDHAPPRDHAGPTRQEPWPVENPEQPASAPTTSSTRTSSKEPSTRASNRSAPSPKDSHELSM